MLPNKKIIEQLIEQINIAKNNDEIPVGAIIYDKECNIISKSCNNRQQNNNILGHAEINSIIAAEDKINDWRLDGYYMVVSLEPCEMCKSIIKESRINKVYYFLNNNKISTIEINQEKIDPRLFNKEYRFIEDILKEYFKSKR